MLLGMPLDVPSAAVRALEGRTRWLEDPLIAAGLIPAKAVTEPLKQGAKAMGKGGARVFSQASKDVPTEAGYLYHVTNAERAGDIAEGGLLTHKPWEHTDQSMWPDGSVRKRSYFTENSVGADFAPEEGQSAVLRMKKPNAAQRESGTGDWYMDRKVPPSKLEVLTPGGWEPLSYKTATKEFLDPHGIYGIRPEDKPWDAYQYTLQQNREMAPRAALTPEDIFREFRGSMILPAIGDKSIGGHLVSNIEGMPVNVQTHGGADFMRTHSGHGTVWASELSPMQSLRRQVDEAAQKTGKPVLLSHSTMAPKSIDFSHHVSDAVLDMLPQNTISATGAKEFDNLMRVTGFADSGTSGGRAVFPDFPGINSPKLRKWLDGSGQRRKWFVKGMNKAQFRKEGFPDVGAARIATTDPGQLGVPRFATGRDISLVQPSLTKDPYLMHPSYPVQMHGQYLGGLKNYRPVQDVFQTWWDQAHKLDAPARAWELGGSGRGQIIDEQWLDRMLKTQ